MPNTHCDLHDLKEPCYACLLDDNAALRAQVEVLEQMQANDAASAAKAIKECVKLRARVEKLERLVKCLVEEDPNEQIDDRGSTVLDAWRHDARAALAECGEGE